MRNIGPVMELSGKPVDEGGCERHGHVDQRFGGGGAPDCVPPWRALCAVKRAVIGRRVREGCHIAEVGKVGHLYRGARGSAGGLCRERGVRGDCAGAGRVRAAVPAVHVLREEDNSVPVPRGAESASADAKTVGEWRDGGYGTGAPREQQHGGAVKDGLGSDDPARPRVTQGSDREHQLQAGGGVHGRERAQYGHCDSGGGRRVVSGHGAARKSVRSVRARAAAV
ncbi:hypothetical protein FGB62_39g112 [Gracilaria domingensis]|nr:hypothetical protein FGB62_39g112 [Gracilaria domingensis]